MNKPMTAEEVGALINQQAEMHRMALQIADETCRADVETIARSVPSNHPMPVYDVTALEPVRINDAEMVESDREYLARAVRYLDLRGLLVRPIKGSPQLVAFAKES